MCDIFFILHVVSVEYAPEMYMHVWHAAGRAVMAAPWGSGPAPPAAGLQHPGVSQSSRHTALHLVLLPAGSGPREGQPDFFFYGRRTVGLQIS
jgi:hypothetical protein